MKGETRLKAWIVGMAPLFFLPLYGALVGLVGYPMLVYTNFIHSLFGEYVGYLIIGITLAPFAFFDHEYPRFYKSFGKYSEKAKSWEKFHWFVNKMVLGPYGMSLFSSFGYIFCFGLYT